MSFLLFWNTKYKFLLGMDHKDFKKKISSLAAALRGIAANQPVCNKTFKKSSKIYREQATPDVLKCHCVKANGHFVFLIHI